MSDDDKLLNYAILIVRDARAEKLNHDPAVAMQALMHLLETIGGLWKDYQSLLKVELKRLPQSSGRLGSAICATPRCGRMLPPQPPAVMSGRQ